MKPLSIENAYVWAQRFVGREWRLILPVALAFMALPPLALYLLVPQAQQALDPATLAKNPAAGMTALAWAVPAQLLILLFSAAGSLAVTALALVPGISVHAALILARNRLGVLVGSLLLAGLADLLLLTVIVVLLGFTGTNLLTIQSLALGILIGFTLFLVIRLTPLVPLVVKRRIGPLSALRESWIMTGRVFWRVFGAVIIYSIGALIVMIALTTGLGSVLLLLGKAVGSPELGNALSAILICILGAAARTGFNLLAAALYRQLDGANEGI